MQGYSRQNNEHQNKLTIEIDEDPRIKSKCSTPKKSSFMKKDIDKQKQRSLHFQGSYEKTQEKKMQFQDKAKLKGSNLEFQRLMADKVASYEVVAGTLREYVKQKSRQSRKSKYLPTVISILKAYTKSQIEQLSPNVSELIKKMLDTLPTKKSSKSLRTSKQTHSNSQDSQQNRGHDYTFSRQKGQKQKSKKNLKTQINELEQNLMDLKQQCQVLQQIRSQFQGMQYDDKQDYIRELEQIVQKQKMILGKLGAVDEEY